MVEVSKGESLLARLKRIPMTEWVWSDALDIFAALEADKPATLQAERDRYRMALAAAWREGWSDAKACLTEDEAFGLTDDVRVDAWSDSATRELYEQTPSALSDAPVQS